MKYYTRLKVFKGPNCMFNPETLLSTSYGWYEMTKRIGGKSVENTYNYSPTTIKHRYSVESILGYEFEFDYSFEAPNGLQDLEAAVKHYERKIADLKAAIAKKGSKFKTNQGRIDEIADCEYAIKQIKELQAIELAEEVA